MPPLKASSSSAPVPAVNFAPNASSDTTANTSNNSNNTGNSNTMSEAAVTHCPSSLEGSRAEKHQPLNEPYAQKLLHNLNELRADKRFCDVEIIAGDQILHAHRIVLSASSRYFEAMFRPTLGLCEGQQRSIVLHTVDAPTLRHLMDFIYTGRIVIKQSNVQELLAAGDMLQLPEVVAECCSFLRRELHATNALGILRFAETHHCEELVRSAQSFVHTHFPQVAMEDELLDTPFSLLARILTSECLRVDTESQVFQAAIRWFKHDVKERRKFVFDMLSHIRLALVPIQLLDAAIDECHDSSLLVALRSVRYDLATGKGSLVPLRACPRVCARKSIYIFGGAKRETSSGWNPHDCIFDTVAKYDIFRAKWLEAAPMQIGRIQPGVATLGGKIYVIGGERGSQILANGEVYDPQTDQWAKVSPMIVPRCEFGLCPLGGTLWAVGGWIGVDIGGTMECYDPGSDAWTEAGLLPEPRFSMGVVSFEGLIYMVGGCTTSSRHLADVCAFNPVTGEWTELAAMQTARCQLGVAILGRWLYVVGGNDRNQEVLKSTERYSFDEDRWESVTPMQVCRASPAVTAADGLLYVAGGDQACEVNFYRAQITISSVECYDPLKDLWTYCPELPVSRSEAGAIVL